MSFSCLGLAMLGRIGVPDPLPERPGPGAIPPPVASGSMDAHVLLLLERIARINALVLQVQTMQLRVTSRELAAQHRVLMEAGERERANSTHLLMGRINDLLGAVEETP
jgi:hypothetical protein